MEIPYVLGEITALNFFDIIAFFTIFIFLGFVSIQTYSLMYSLSRREKQVFLFGLIFRVGLTFGYYFLFLNSYADAKGYYNYAYEHGLDLVGLFTPGSSFVNNYSVVIYHVVKFFDNPYLTMYIPFSLAGFWGTMLLYSVVKSNFSDSISKKNVTIISVCLFFLPNMVFWSSNIGKDSIIFFGICLYIFGLMGNFFIVRKVVIISSALAIIYLVRPHIFLFLIFSTIIGTVADKNRNKKANWFFIGISIVVMMMFYDSVLKFVGIDSKDEDGSNVTEYYEQGIKQIEYRAEVLNMGGSSINRSSTSVLMSPLYAIGFITQPFFWQVRNLNQLISAFDSLIFQIIIIYIMINFRKYIRFEGMGYKYFPLIFLVITSVVFGMGFTNIGLIVRQKNMITPALLLLFFSILAKNESRKNME